MKLTQANPMVQIYIQTFLTEIISTEKPQTTLTSLAMFTECSTLFNRWHVFIFSSLPDKVAKSLVITYT